MTSSFPFRGCYTGVVGAGQQGNKTPKKVNNLIFHALSQQKKPEVSKSHGNNIAIPGKNSTIVSSPLWARNHGPDYPVLPENLQKTYKI